MCGKHDNKYSPIMNANKQVSLSEITSGILRAVPDAPAFVAGVRSMLNAGPDKKMSIGLLLEKQARRHPASPALKFEDKVWSYAGFNGWVNRIAALYQQMGVGEGDVVAIMSENRPAMLACDHHSSLTCLPVTTIMPRAAGL